MPATLVASAPERTLNIAQARRALLYGEVSRMRQAAAAGIDSCITRSWQRCIASGEQPDLSVRFEPVSKALISDVAERNRPLLAAARPVVERLSRIIADTRYFALVTDARGIIVDVGTLPGGTGADSRHARDIARVGVDLSEHAVGTTAIGTVLAENESVWLHQGEHFFDCNSVYSCAGAPLFGPQGDCIGVLDITGVQVAERPEMRHLALQAARSIENMLVMQSPCEMLLFLAWPGSTGGESTEGMLCVDAEGQVTGANAAARQMLYQPVAMAGPPLHCSDLFGIPLQMLLDAARRGEAVLEVPLWSGLRVQVRPRRGGARVPGTAVDAAPRLRDVETALIRKAVADARGNVAEAARALGISRATVYRRLWRGRTAGAPD